jgi:hypothetical protein
MYTIRHLRYDELYQLSEFVVMQNYLHQEYLGSPTLAVYSSKADLTPFYEKYESCITMYSRRNPE